MLEYGEYELTEHGKTIWTIAMQHAIAEKVLIITDDYEELYLVTYFNNSREDPMLIGRLSPCPLFDKIMRFMKSSNIG